MNAIHIFNARPRLFAGSLQIQAITCGARMIAVKAKSMMKSKSHATRRLEIGNHMRVPNDVMPSSRMWLAMPTP